MASLLHKELEVETGIKPNEGLLDKPGMLEFTESQIIGILKEQEQGKKISCATVLDKRP